MSLEVSILLGTEPNEIWNKGQNRRTDIGESLIKTILLLTVSFGLLVEH
jgi:hypothetical protein